MEKPVGREIRIDYVKFSIRAAVDLCWQYRQQFVELMGEMPEFTDKDSGYNAMCVRAYKDGTYLYVYEAWGKLADNVVFMAWNPWHQFIERMDIRYETEVSVDGVEAFRAHCNQFGTSGRNVQTFNSRARTKRNGRDAGGYGLAVGSHKSEFRMSAYKRGKEASAVEFQFRGKRLKAAAAMVEEAKQRREAVSLVDPWRDMAYKLAMMARRDVRTIAGLELEELDDLLQTGVGDTLQEAALRRIESDVKRLDRTALEVARGYIQERLILDF